jgi:hypothetical protein
MEDGMGRPWAPRLPGPRPVKEEDVVEVEVVEKSKTTELSTSSRLKDGCMRIGGYATIGQMQ